MDNFEICKHEVRSKDKSKPIDNNKMKDLITNAKETKGKVDGDLTQDYDNMDKQEAKFHVNIMDSVSCQSAQMFDKALEHHDDKRGQRKTLLVFLFISFLITFALIAVCIGVNICKQDNITSDTIIVSLLAYSIANIFALLAIYLKYITTDNTLDSYVTITKPLLEFSKFYMQLKMKKTNNDVDESRTEC